MREIKFRAWDIKNQKYLYFFIDKFPSNPQTIKIPTQVKIQLYTGLKDKNGKEIYEGEVIEDGDAGIFFEVFFMEGGFWGREINTSSNDVMNLSELCPSCEIIGNIYENPELLK